MAAQSFLLSDREATDNTMASSSQSRDVDSAEKGIQPFEEPFEMRRTRTESTCKEGQVIDALDTTLGADGVHYKTMKWWHVGMLMIAETISLGVLSLPSAIARVGLVPGVILISGLGLLATYSGYVIGQFKLRHPTVLSFADAGEILFGAFGRELFGLAAILSFIFVMAAHLLAFSVMMNVLTDHGTCSVVFGFVGFAASVLMTLPRTLQKVSYISIVSCISIVSAVVIVMVSLGITHKGGENVDLFVHHGSLTPMFVGILDIMLAYSGNAAFFGFVSELKDPKTYPKALYLLQGVAVTFYIVVATVIYWYVGREVDSPALGAAGPLVRKIAYGIATPTILVAGVINGHVASKMLYIRLWLRLNPSIITSKKPRAYLSWAAIVSSLWLVAWVLAEAIPIFNELLGLMSALFMSWFTYGIGGMLWLHMNRGRWMRGWRKCGLCGLNFGMILIGVVTCGLGLYASGVEISKATGGLSFSCANNDPKAAVPLRV